MSSAKAEWREPVGWCREPGRFVGPAFGLTSGRDLDIIRCNPIYIAMALLPDELIQMLGIMMGRCQIGREDQTFEN